MQTESIIVFQQFCIVDSYVQINSTVVTHCCLAMVTSAVRNQRNVPLYIHFLPSLFTQMDKKKLCRPHKFVLSCTKLTTSLEEVWMKVWTPTSAYGRGHSPLGSLFLQEIKWVFPFRITTVALIDKVSIGDNYRLCCVVWRKKIWRHPAQWRTVS